MIDSNDAEVLDSMAEDGIDRDQDWDNEMTVYELDGTLLLVSAAGVDLS